MKTFACKQPTHAELESWKQQIIDHAVGWHRGINKIDEPRLEAFSEGMKQGMDALIATLRMHNVMPQERQFRNGKVVG